jgi:molybdate transport system substrate-binding protein
LSRTVHLLSAGAAKGLVQGLAARFAGERGAAIAGTFNAVGTIRDAFAAGEPCDVLILTAPMLATLAQSGHVLADSLVPLGRVETGIAVRSGQPHPPIGDDAALRTLFGSATGLYCPDPERATAGIHFVKVLRALGLWPEVEPRLRAYASGGIAMQAMAEAAEPGLVGCTQVTEILYTPGVELVGPLPPGHALATVYAAAVAARASDPALARQLVALLAADDTRALREAGGLRT